MKRIMITGCPSSGKSTLARKISQKTNIPILHLDQIFHRTGKPIKPEIFVAEIKKFIEQNESWITDGDFTRMQSFELQLQHADTVIIYELPKRLLFFRLLKRFFMYSYRTRPDMPEAYKETVSNNLKVAKQIWNYTTEVAWEKIGVYEDSKQVIVLRNQHEEAGFIDSL
jgi:adenylate kinase family enzyme